MSRNSAASRFEGVASFGVVFLFWCAAGLGQVITQFPLDEYVGGIASGPDGAIWFSSLGKIGRIDMTGAISEFPTPTAGDPQNGKLTFGSDGNLWFTGPGRMSRMTTSGVVTEFSVPDLQATSTSITSGPDGNIWFTAFSANLVGRITTSGLITTFQLSAGAFPVGIVAGPDGSLWFTESGAQKIGRITTNGAITEFGLPSTDSFPSGIAPGPDGALWFTEQPSRVGRITPTGQVTEFAVSGGETFFVTACSDGNLWFVGWGEVHRVTTTGSVTTFSQIPTYEPGGVAVTPDGAIWIVGHSVGFGGPVSQIIRFALDTAPCLADATSLCLNNGRFRVTADWKTGDGSHGQGRGASLSSNSGCFWFFDRDNVELVVKVLDGCSIGGSYWVFAAGLTHVAVTMTVTDMYTGIQKTYVNPQGTAFMPIQDTRTFTTCQ